WPDTAAEIGDHMMAPGELAECGVQRAAHVVAIRIDKLLLVEGGGFAPVTRLVHSVIVLRHRFFNRGVDVRSAAPGEKRRHGRAFFGRIGSKRLGATAPIRHCPERLARARRPTEAVLARRDRIPALAHALLSATDFGARSLRVAQYFVSGNRL